MSPRSAAPVAGIEVVARLLVHGSSANPGRHNQTVPVASVRAVAAPRAIEVVAVEVAVVEVVDEVSAGQGGVAADGEDRRQHDARGQDHTGYRSVLSHAPHLSRGPIRQHGCILGPANAIGLRIATDPNRCAPSRAPLALR